MDYAKGIRIDAWQWQFFFQKARNKFAATKNISKFMLR